MDLNDLKKLAGINSFTGYQEYKVDSTFNKKEIESTNNIKAGSDEWFKLWFTSNGPAMSAPPGFRSRKK